MFLLAPISIVRADQIEMQNGDRYFGAVLSMSAESIVLQSEILGQIKIPRGKVSTITLGNIAAHPSVAANSGAPGISPTGTNSPSDASDPLRQLGANTNLVQQIRKQFLSDAGPQANDKFDELLTGLMTGKLDMNGLRAEAKAAADQLRAAKKDMGGDSFTLDAYLGVLDNFIAQSAPPAAPPPTNSPKGTIIIR
jgi:hypothetical protein